ncbi:G2/mitotic-specific cyclin-A isoform X2 [Rhagoletis pomonella]|uniref:G2/mitotic-specific cyclin-A isoform X1 n=1 Tax=Rhagoletis pomonella TaxID=28610 RepID=UPI00177DB4BD|nr:G2/mitotic-specific cyclin-A isoform X1 [Rhagoletis pomonella]XP_036327093.1 G2/mitotic-specific cyclin-A isoform X2 [Rhagoletis pomonella]
MATFHIHQDAEKENPHMPAALKEKTLATGSNRVNALQPSILGAAAGPIKGKQADGAGRSNLAVLNANTNNGHGRNTAGGMAGSKVAFREVGNANTHNENTAIFAAAAAAVKKTVVEQFQSFSVYEDQPDMVQKYFQPHFVAADSSTSTSYTSAIASTEITQTEKENIYTVQQSRHIKNDFSESSTKENSVNDECALDTTPMSVSEVLSPMSVDRSHIGITQPSDSQLLDDDNDDKKVADLTIEEEERERRHLVPRNDRQRFFEVVEYQRNILEYFLESEKKHRPKPHYMRRQADINHSMRTILVDWLVEVSEEYNLDTETLYLSVSYIDRFLSQMSVVRSKLQLVGTAAMYIASKYEEIYPPDVGEFVFITDDTYNKAQVLRMEQIILKILAFDLCTPTAYVFINTYAVLLDMTDRLKYLTQYICELALLEADPYLRFLPSLISAAALALSRHLLDYAIWTRELEEVTSYSLEDLKEVFLHLCKTHNAATKLAQQAIQEKYRADKYKKVSTIKPAELDEAAFEALLRKHNAFVRCEDTQENSTSGTNNEHVRRAISLMFN